MASLPAPEGEFCPSLLSTKWQRDWHVTAGWKVCQSGCPGALGSSSASSQVGDRLWRHKGRPAREQSRLGGASAHKLTCSARTSRHRTPLPDFCLPPAASLPETPPACPGSAARPCLPRVGRWRLCPPGTWQPATRRAGLNSAPRRSQAMAASSPPKFKLILLGDFGVGKTTLFHRVRTGHFLQRAHAVGQHPGVCEKALPLKPPRSSLQVQ
ncbi:hypothetical protein lerEdw1_014805, partial [Lerista edwardsae]